MTKKIIILLGVLAVFSVSTPLNIRILAWNQLNCGQYDSKGDCVKCSHKYYFDSNRDCTQVSALCKTWNDSTGSCTTCYEGSIIQNGACIKKNLDVNCKKAVNQICQQCSLRFYIDSASGICKGVSAYCKSWNLTNGFCTSCYDGNFVSDGKCVKKIVDINCKTIVDNSCKQCYLRWFVDAISGVCKKVSDYCKTYNLGNGTCTSCYDGSQIKDSACVLKLVDKNCKTVTNNSCTQCLPRFFLNSLNKRCTGVSAYCFTYSNITGHCTSCSNGRIVINGACVVKNTDGNCKKVINNLCTQCYSRFYVNSATGKCTGVSGYCNTFSLTTGGCTSCYSGYKLSTNQCVRT